MSSEVEQVMERKVKDICPSPMQEGLHLIMSQFLLSISVMHITLVLYILICIS